MAENYTIYVCKNDEKLLPCDSRYEIFRQDSELFDSIVEEAVAEAEAKNELPKSVSWRYERDYSFWHGGYSRHCTAGYCVVVKTAPQDIRDIVDKFDSDFYLAFDREIESFLESCEKED